MAGSSAEGEQASRAIADALRLVQNYEPLVLSEARRDIRLILVTAAPGGEYLEHVRMCRLSLGYTSRASALKLAMMFVHEACHAKIAQEGVRYTADNRENIERRCVDAEIAFAQRVPNSAEAIAGARASLLSEWWDVGKHSDSMIATLRQRGVPRWIASWLVKRNVSSRMKSPQRQTAPVAAPSLGRSFPRMCDTSAEAATVQIAAFRRLSPAERVALAFEASEWVMAVARARSATASCAPSPAGAPVADSFPALPGPRAR